MKQLKSLVLVFIIIMIPSIVHSETVSIQCSCKTKHNPSECSIATQAFQVIDWNEDAHTNSNINWDEKMISEYCQRHAHISCMCNGEGIYSGKLID